MFYPDLEQIQRLLAILLQDDEAAEALAKLAERLQRDKNLLREVKDKYLSSP